MKRLTDEELSELDGYVRGVVFFGSKDPLRHIPGILAEVQMWRREKKLLKKHRKWDKHTTLVQMKIARDVARSRAGRIRLLEDALERKKQTVRELTRRIEAAGIHLSDNGCDCDCGHTAYEDHDDACELCLACRVNNALCTGSY